MQKTGEAQTICRLCGGPVSIDQTVRYIACPPSWEHYGNCPPLPRVVAGSHGLSREKRNVHVLLGR